LVDVVLQVFLKSKMGRRRLTQCVACRVEGRILHLHVGDGERLCKHAPQPYFKELLTLLAAMLQSRLEWGLKIVPVAQSPFRSQFKEVITMPVALLKWKPGRGLKIVPVAWTP